MATWFTITFEGEPTEADFARVAQLAAEGYTSGQLINEPGAEHEEGPATGIYGPHPFSTPDGNKTYCKTCGRTREAGNHASAAARSTTLAPKEI